MLPRTRSIAATMDLSHGEGQARKTLLASLEPTAPGDPLLARYHATVPAMPTAVGKNNVDGNVASPALTPIGVALSATAAEKLGVRQGDPLLGRVERRYQGQVQSARVPLRVVAVLPLAAQQKDVAYVPLPLLEATEDFRDGAPCRSWARATAGLASPGPTARACIPASACTPATCGR